MDIAYQGRIGLMVTAFADQLQFVEAAAKESR